MKCVVCLERPVQDESGIFCKECRQSHDQVATGPKPWQARITWAAERARYFERLRSYDEVTRLLQCRKRRLLGAKDQ